MQPETIRRTVSLFEEQPEKAQSTPPVKAHADGGQAVMEAGPFSWRSDLPEPIGGTNQALSPTALLLGALAGCAVVFIRDTLAPPAWRPRRCGGSHGAVRGGRARPPRHGRCRSGPEERPARHPRPVARWRRRGAEGLRGLAGALPDLPCPHQRDGRLSTRRRRKDSVSSVHKLRPNFGECTF